MNVDGMLFCQHPHDLCDVVFLVLLFFVCLLLTLVVSFVLMFFSLLSSLLCDTRRREKAEEELHISDQKLKQLDSVMQRLLKMNKGSFSLGSGSGGDQQ